MKFVIPGRLPCMNDLITTNRRNRYAGAKLKKDTQKQIEDVLLPQIQLRSTARYGFSGKVAVIVRFYEPDKRRDEDNVLSGMKFIFDAMQGIGLIENDNQAHLHIAHAEVFVDKKNPRIEIELEQFSKNTQKHP